MTKNSVNGFVATFGKMTCKLNFEVVCGHNNYCDQTIFFVTEKPIDSCLCCQADVVFAKGDKIVFSYIIDDKKAFGVLDAPECYENQKNQ